MRRNVNGVDHVEKRDMGRLKVMPMDSVLRTGGVGVARVESGSTSWMLQTSYSGNREYGLSQGVGGREQ